MSIFNNMTGAASNLMSGGSGQQDGAGSSFKEGNFDGYTNFANAILDRAMLQAIPYTEKNTQYEIGRAHV